MTAKKSTPRLTLGSTTLAAHDLDRRSAFYRDVLGFHVAHRGPTPDESEIAFLSQDPSAHHQIAMVGGLEPPDAAFVMVDRLAFRTGTLEDLRALRVKPLAAHRTVLIAPRAMRSLNASGHRLRCGSIPSRTLEPLLQHHRV